MRKSYTYSLTIVAFAAILLLIGGCGSGESGQSENGQSENAQSAKPTPPSPTDGADPVAETVNSASEPSITIVAMGDSLTEGLGVEPEFAYPAQLEERLLADGYNVEVINAGISGETSSGALSRINWILTLEPDIVILETGANDGLRGIDPEVTAKNIDELVAAFSENDVTVVLAGMQIVQNMGAEYVEEFRAIYPAAAKAHNVPLIPFFLKNVAASRTLNQPDEIHPTAEGYAIVIETIYPYVVEVLDQ